MTHSFRIRVNASKTDKLNADQNRLTVACDEPEISVVLVNPQQGEPLKGASRLALVGSGYKTSEEALIAGQNYLNSFLYALAKVRLGVDFGAKGQRSVVTSQGLAYFQAQSSKRILNDFHGLMTYESLPAPAFMSASGEMTRFSSPEKLLFAIAEGIKSNVTFTDQEYTSLTFFNASFFQPDEESRFVMLMMAIEALLQPAQRSPAALALVSELIEKVKSSHLCASEKDAMLGSLSWLRNDSIAKTGQILATQRLGSNSYDTQSPAKFFSRCYALRSKLVHGHLPVSAFIEIAAVSAPLELFVSDLLTLGKLH